VWYNNAEDIIAWATLVLSALAWAATSRFGRWRALPLVVIAFGVGLYLGVQVTATGHFLLPLGPMQAQMHAVWGIPAKGLEPPQQ
jgi:hypothetical protein